jgi:hypothetical protein
MQFADYNAFRVSLQWLIEGDELSDTFSVNTLDLIIGLGEGRVYLGDRQSAGLRASSMQKPLSQVVTSNVATLPTDLLELREARFAGEAPLEIIPLDRLRTLVDIGGGGTTRYAAQDGDTLVFCPEASGTLIGSYYARPQSLQTVTWSNATTFARYPELFTYACLFEAALFLGMDSKMPIWESRYRQLADGANRAERMRTYGGSPLTVRTR